MHKNTDLNLFKVFIAIYQQQNLTRAAEALSVTQPAVSNALNRLRINFNDQLFIRTHLGMTPTPFSESIIERVQEAIQLLNSSLSSKELFEPANSKRRFSISMNDLMEGILLPKLIERIQKEAPNIILECFHVGRPNLESELGKGSIDLALDVAMANSSSQLEMHKIESAPFVCVVRKDHPSIKDTLSMQEYLDLKHIVVSSRRKGLSYEDSVLKRLGHKRKIALRIPYYRVAPLIVEQSDLAITVPRSLVDDEKFKVLQLPFDVSNLKLNLYWHKNTQDDPGIIWLRSIVSELALNFAN